MNVDPLPVLAPQRLLEITGDDTELFGDMIEEFQHNLAAYAKDLRNAEDRAGWRAVAHKLKGAAQAIGAEAIAAIAILAELSAPGDAVLLARLDAEIERFQAL
jgi:HPt (histidine-containing phosphotransfer) domain-containing protein